MLNERPRVAIHALLSLAQIAMGVSACAEASPDEALAPRACNAQRCPDGGCRLTVELADTCTDVGAVEVLLDGALEPRLLGVDAPWVSDGQIPVGVPVAAYFKADDFAWSLEVSCPEQAPNRGAELLLTCDGGAGVRVRTPSATSARP